MNEEEIQVHAAGAESFKLIAALYAKAFDDPWPEPSVRELMGTPGVFALIASEGDTPLGFILARVVADEAELLSIGTVPEARQRGIAGKMLETAIRLTKEHAAAFFLEVGEDNPDAERLYLNRGFEVVGRRRGYYRRANGRVVDASIMRLDLKS